MRSDGQVCRPERLRDHDLRVGQFALEYGLRSVLVGSDDQLVPVTLEILAQAESSRNAAEKLTGAKVDSFRSGCRLAAGVAVDLGTSSRA